MLQDLTIVSLDDTGNGILVGGAVPKFCQVSQLALCLGFAIDETSKTYKVLRLLLTTSVLRSD